MFFCVFLHWSLRMYTVPERERLTPSPSDSPRARYTMQPFLQDQFVTNLTPSRLYNSERTVPQTSSMLSPALEDAGAAQRWLVTSVQQTSANKLELTAYEGDYSSSLLPYSFKSLPLQSAHTLGYYPDAAFTSVTAGWGSRGSYPRKVASGLPWSPRPSPTELTDDHVLDKDKSREGNTVSQTVAWMENTPSLKPLDSEEPSIYSVVCKRRRVSLDESGAENSLTVKCEDSSASETFTKDTSSNSKTIGYYAFYAGS